jgi:uncharacterized protein
MPDDLLFDRFGSTLHAMKLAQFHFDDGLRPLLASDKRYQDFVYLFSGPQSIKHLIESLGIPHTEFGHLYANDHAVDINYLVSDGDRLEVYSTAPTADSILEPRFVLDGHLGRLTAYLRMLGHDCDYQNDFTDDELAEISSTEDRILLTRDRRLLMRKVVIQGYLLRSTDPRTQLQEVVSRYGLQKWIQPFQRCIHCNHKLESVRKQDILERLEPFTKLYFDEFRICPNCQQIYWKGSHFDKMRKLIANLK